MRRRPLFVSGILGDDIFGTGILCQFQRADGHRVLTQRRETDLWPRRERCHGEHAQRDFDRALQLEPTLADTLRPND